MITNQRKEGKLLGSTSGDPYGITKFIADTKEEVAYFDRVNIMCSIYPDNYVTKKEKKKTVEETETEDTSNNQEEADE